MLEALIDSQDLDLSRNLDLISEQFEDAHPQDILNWAVDSYTDKLALVTSFQPTGIVTLHMLQVIGAYISVITLDTGLLFPETQQLIEQVEARFDISVTRVKPTQTLDQQAVAHGDALWQSNPDLCCQLRKVKPLKEALTGYGAWITGLRRDQSKRRANTPIVSWDKRHNMVKLCPFATWTESMIWTYINAYDLPYNTLHDQGFPSIGCYTCTHAVNTDDDPRAGRWSRYNKTECGIHVQEGGL